MYTMNGKIRFSECDTTQKVTLPGIINYFQDCSTFQSESLGRGADYLRKKNRAWLLSSWQVVVERYPAIGEEIEVKTWASGFKGFYGTRNFMMQTTDGERLAYANSIWSFVDIEAGHPARPDAEDVAVYGEEPALEMEYAPRKIKLPKETVSVDTFPVRKYHIDTNHHVNNCQYVQMALEVLTEAPRTGQVRVEYRKAAVYGDIILPKIAEEEERIVVELCDMEEKPYAIVEFIGER